MSPSDSNPKFDKFKQELKDLLDRYQYRQIPLINYSADGVTAYIRIVDVPPQDAPKKETKKEEKPKIEEA